MKVFGNKVDNSPTESGIVNASDYNSVFKELDNAVSPFMTPTESLTNQLAKSNDIALKHLTYEYAVKDGNNIILKRAGLNALKLETLTDRMYITFLCEVTNTGAMTVKIGDLPTKPVKIKGQDPVSGHMIVNAYFSLTYIESSGQFELESVSGDNLYYRRSHIDGNFYNRPQIDSKFSGVIKQLKFYEDPSLTFGYVIYDTGMIVQWRQSVVPKDGHITELFPIAYPNKVISVQATFVHFNGTRPSLYVGKDARLFVYNIDKGQYSILNGYEGVPTQLVSVISVGY